MSRPGDRVPGLVLLALAAAAALEARTFEVAFITDPLGPKAFPLTASALLAGSGLVLLLRPAGGFSFPATPVLATVAAGVAAFLAYAALLPVLGFVPATTLAIWSLSLLFGAPRWASLLAALAFSVALQLLFVQGLALALPGGSLWTLPGAPWTR